MMAQRVHPSALCFFIFSHASCAAGHALREGDHRASASSRSDDWSGSRSQSSTSNKNLETYPTTHHFDYFPNRFTAFISSLTSLGMIGIPLAYIDHELEYPLLIVFVPNSSHCFSL